MEKVEIKQIILEDLTLEELETKATELRVIRDNATKELHKIVKLIDGKHATESVKNIVSGLSDEQKNEMYAQLVGVKSAVSTANAKGNK